MNENCFTFESYQEPGLTAVSGFWALFTDMDGSFGGKL